MRVSFLSRSFLVILPLLAGCATAPTGPSVLAMPRGGRSYDQFHIDDTTCRGYAQAQTGGTSAVNNGVTSAIAGTVVGAAAGAAMGGEHGAGVGAGAGLLAGSLFGIGFNQSSAQAAQRGYDHAYIQCMYAKGHQVPVSGAVVQTVPVYQVPAYYQVNSMPAAGSSMGGVYLPPPPPPPDGALPTTPPAYPPPPPAPYALP
ncbi:MAG: hypothetical protein HQL66_15075 [Magnetococcales bacterium]|nr:hypothetical protein [Magnetococcales bacterium]